MSWNNTYHIRVRGNVLGPFRREQILKLIERGQLTRMHEVSCDGFDWQPAGDREELFPRPSTSEAATPASTEAAKASLPARDDDSAETIAWYYEHEGRSCGPASPSEIARRIASGELGPEKRVWRDGMEYWRPVHATELAVFLPVPQAKPLHPQESSPVAHGQGDTLPPKTVQLLLDIRLWSGLWAGVFALPGVLLLIASVIMIIFAEKAVERTSWAVMLLISCVTMSPIPFLLAANSSLNAIKYSPKISLLDTVLVRWRAFWQWMALAMPFLIVLNGALIFYILAWQWDSIQQP